MRRALGYALVALLAALATVLASAPAQWVASAVERASGGRVELAAARGSLWSGSATLVLASGDGPARSRASLPEPLAWRVRPASLLAGVLDLEVTHPSALAQPLVLRAGPGAPLSLAATEVRLPAALLAGLGAPWTTVRPGGVLTVAWDRLQIGGQRLEGDLRAEWQQASSALTTVAPIGHYRLLTQGGFPNTQLSLLTLAGPLELQGDGTIDAEGRLRFTGRARAQPQAGDAVRAQLAGLIALLGRRDGDAAILSFGS